MQAKPPLHKGGSVKGLKIAISTVLLTVSHFALADEMTCMDHGRELAVNNDQALRWRDERPSGFHTRAFISGTVDEVFPDRTGHRHFSLKIGPHFEDHIEIVYEQNFGRMPLPSVGDPASACGDYIVATESNGRYPPSPDGALVHWVHRSNNDRHDDGFVVLKGIVYGND
jgi:hypothetical protein